MGCAFIVDGFLEQKAVQKICSGRPVVRTNLNGKSVGIEAIAQAVATLASTFIDDHYPIYVILDRETRSISSVEMEDAIIALLKGHGINTEAIILACPDRMIENWICAGSSSFRDQALFEEERDDYDAMNGKAFLRRELAKANTSYKETTIGSEMLASIDFALACRRSASFQRFFLKALISPHWVVRDEC